MRYEVSGQLTNQVTPLTTCLYRYAFRKVLVSNLNSHIAPEEIPLFEQPTLVSEFGVTWLRDARDNPADATKGSFNSADFSVASTSIGSSASFLRFFFQNSTYHPIKRRFSFARSIRIGILEPFANTESFRFRRRQRRSARRRRRPDRRRRLSRFQNDFSRAEGRRCGDLR